MQVTGRLVQPQAQLVENKAQVVENKVESVKVEEFHLEHDSISGP